MKLKLFLVAIAFHALGSAQEKKYLAQVRLNDKYGYIDTSGKEVVPVIYDDVGAYGSIDDSGTWGDNLIPVNIGKSNPALIEPPMPKLAVDPGKASDSIENSSISNWDRLQESRVQAMPTANGATAMPLAYWPFRFSLTKPCRSERAGQL